MAIGIRNYPQVTPPDSDYPDGRIKDDTGINDGTPINVKTNGDIQQFFAKLMRLAGLAPNSIPDSEYNGFQLIVALDKFVAPSRAWRNVGGGGQPSFGTGFSNSSPSDPVRFSIQRNSVRIIGTLGRLVTAPSLVFFTLPVGLRPNVDVHCALNYYEENGNPFAAHVWIKTNGDVNLIESAIPNVANGFCYVNAEFIIDSI